MIIFMKDNAERLVLDKSKRPLVGKHRGKSEKAKAQKIDFYNFVSGESYLVPYTVDGFNLLGTRYVIYQFLFNEKTGAFFADTPTEVVFIKEKNTMDRELVALVGVDGSRVFNGSCWSTTKVTKIYKIEDRDKAFMEYNNEVKTMLTVREEYINKMKNKELANIRKLLV